MSSLGEELPKEQVRVRELLGEYKAIGNAGLFGVAMIEQRLCQADNAVISGDIVKMIEAFNELKKIE